MGMVIDARLGLENVYEKGHKMFALGGPIQSFIDSTVLKGVEPYVPMRIGTTTRSGVLSTQIGSGMIVWKTPYVRFIWHALGWNFSQRRHPKAGPIWAIRYKQDHLKELEGMVRRKVRQQW